MFRSLNAATFVFAFILLTGCGTKSISQDPFFQEGLSLSAQQPDAAISAFMQSARPEAWFNAAQLARRLQNPSQACAFFQAAFDAKPKHPRYGYWKGECALWPKADHRISLEKAYRHINRSYLYALSQHDPKSLFLQNRQHVLKMQLDMQNRLMKRASEPFFITYQPNQKTLEVHGKFGKGASELFSSYLREHPNIAHVTLNSSGGNLSSGLSIGRLIQEHQLLTSIMPLGKCNSSCALAFLAGKNKQLHAGSELGFHRPWMKEEQKQDTRTLSLALEQIRQYLDSAHQPDWLISRLALFDENEFFYPNVRQLNEMGVEFNPKTLSRLLSLN